MDIRRLCTAIALVLVGGCTFKASCGGTLNTKKAAKFVAGVVEKEAGVVPTKVDCPDGVAVEKGATLDCTVEVEGVTGTFTLVQEDDEGFVSVRAVHGLLITGKLEKTIADGFREKIGIPAQVDCGPRVRAAKPGATFECRASDATGQGVMVGVEVTDDTGNVSWKVLPGTAPPPTPPPTPTPAPTPTP